MASPDEIREFIAGQGFSVEGLGDTDDLFAYCGLDGDDVSEFMLHYAEAFSVDMGNFRWFFHHGEEGANLGALLFAPPYHRVEPIPITLCVLADSTSKGTWAIKYPPHTLPRQRWDVVFNWGLVAGILALIPAAPF